MTTKTINPENITPEMVTAFFEYRGVGDFPIGLLKRILELAPVVETPKVSHVGVASGWVDAAERVPLESDGEVFVRFSDDSIGIAWASYWHGANTGFAQWTFPDPDEDRRVAFWARGPLDAETRNRVLQLCDLILANKSHVIDWQKVKRLRNELGAV